MTERGNGGVRLNLRTFAEADPALRMLMIFGSADRGDAAGRFDHELAYVARAGFDEQTFLEVCVSVIGSASVCLINLRTAPVTLAFRAAREGALVYERESGLFHRFRLRAIHNWCDLEPVIQAAYDRLHTAV
jgi:hypothetical protein